jgi:hypothetical protein
MDKAYKRISKEAKHLEKDIKKTTEQDEKRDKLVKKGKKAMKGKC